MDGLKEGKTDEQTERWTDRKTDGRAQLSKWHLKEPQKAFLSYSGKVEDWEKDKQKKS